MLVICSCLFIYLFIESFNLFNIFYLSLRCLRFISNFCMKLFFLFSCYSLYLFLICKNNKNNTIKTVILNFLFSTSSTDFIIVNTCTYIRNYVYVKKKYTQIHPTNLNGVSYNFFFVFAYFFLFIFPVHSF